MFIKKKKSPHHLSNEHGAEMQTERSVGGRTESCDTDERPKAQQANMVRGDSALT